MRKKDIDDIRKIIRQELIANEKGKIDNKIEKKKTPIPKQDNYERTVQRSKQENMDIQKSFYQIMLFSIIAIFAFLIVLFVKPRLVQEDNTNKPSDINIDNDVHEVDKKNDPIMLQENGELLNSNIEVVQLFNRISFLEQEKLFYDSTYLFSKEAININDIDDNYLLVLLTKTNTFKEYIAKMGLSSKEEVCGANSIIQIPIIDFDQLTKSVFNRQLVEHKDFTYIYYYDDQFITFLQFKFDGSVYNATCIDNLPKKDYNITVTPVMSQAYKEDNIVKIVVRSVFIDKDGNAYGDFEKRRFLFTNKNIYEQLHYISYADRYEFTYVYNDDNYYLEQITKLNNEE